MIDVNSLYEEDCRDTMVRIPDNFIDITVTSPPYEDLRNYNNTLVWNFDIFKDIANSLYRVTKKGGVVVWVVGDKTDKGSESGISFKQALYFKEIGFNLHDTMIYKKNNYMTLNHNRYEQEFEYMFVFSKGKPKTFNSIKVPCTWHGRDSNRDRKVYTEHEEKNKRVRSGKNRNSVKEYKIKGNVWDYHTGYLHSSMESEVFKHPAVFPEKLAEDHILSWSNEGDVVYDPMAGSGTTLKMAKIHHRLYIGSEKVPEYCSIIKERLNKYLFI